MKQLSGPDLAKRLEAHGWRLARINGSHHIYVKDGTPARISVPFHGSRPLKRGLVRHLLRLAELDPE